MAFIRNNLIVVLLFAACIVGLVVYQNYFSGDETELLTSSDPTGDFESEELLVSLANLKSVTLESSLFSDSIFLSLVDFGIAIPAQPVGRTNPFAPLSAQAAQSGNSSVPATTVRSTR